MDPSREPYQQVIVDHSKRPRNRGKLEHSNRKAEGVNTLCGDQVTVYLEVENDIVKDVRFEGGGCAISTASASMMTEAVKSKSLSEVETLFEEFHRLVTSTEPGAQELGKLAVFSGVREFPVRVKCATLVWHTLHEAIRNKGGGA